MAVANETIIKKMFNELNEAKGNQHNHDKLVKHIANVKLLCDLFLEEDDKEAMVKPVQNKEQFSQAELKAMIGEQEAVKKIQKEQSKKLQTINHEEANGSSIFDF
ncbi:YwdI family protein [Oceanobacillus salinisoli]|uniref:YwdI family protein n=1 Tax=Oceanobacillus salinisoli TaxID=2678611 RepID=UPI0012E276B4|nr:YwdI family protein [Oceanobacillus salinisoli]